MSEKLAYNVAEAADALGVSIGTVRGLMATGDLPAIKVGGRRVITREDIEAFIKRAAA